VGDRIEFARSRTPPIALDPVASTHLFLGDETSIAATEALVRALPERVSVLACFEVDALAQRWPEAELLRPGSVCWVERAGRPGTALLSWLARESLRDAPSTTAYVTGEAWLCTLVLSHLVRERGIRASAVRALPYWRQRAHAS
jgi:NADPH-dependent ferric siderophore reductase